MRGARWSRAVSLVVTLGVAALAQPALAQQKPRAAAPAKPKKAAPKPLPRAKKRPEKPEKPAESAESAAAPPSAPPAPAAAPESEVKSAGTQAVEEKEKDKKAASVVKETENKEGVKSFQFGAIEVEGRLKSPQIVFFLRRVRAEFEAGALGHRTFLRELSDTRRDSALR